MTALTDQGQPRDIKAQIRQMVASYIAQERTIILMVCPARPDLEADPALELVKEYDPQGSRTVGVLTKVDLMNAGVDVLQYLSNAVPADLQLDLGYFAVRNRSPQESKGRGALTVREGFAAEANYFAKHSSYGRASAAVKTRLGVPPLCRFLAKVLLRHLKEHLPAIMAEVGELVASTERELALLGPPIPSDDASTSALLHTMIASFCREFVGSLVEKRPNIRVGRRLKDSFVQLQQQLRIVSPFDAASFSDAYLLEAAKDCEGNHLSMPIPPIELLEHLLQHPEQRPIRQLLAPCLATLNTVHEELRAMAEAQLRGPPVNRFPSLQSRIREEVSSMLARHHQNCQTKLEELIDMEEAYISTDDAAFLKELSAVVKKLVNGLDAPLLRSILVSYYGTVIRSVSNSAPKAMMLFMIRASQDGIYSCLFDRIARQPPAGLLDEPPEMESKRQSDLEVLAKLRAARGALESLS